MTALTKMTRFGDRREKHRRKVRDALLRAADQIETEPKRFSFTSVLFSKGAYECGQPFCALGWVAFYFGLDRDTETGNMSLERAAELMFGYKGNQKAQKFYDRLDGIHGNWRSSAALCADALRTHADQDFPTPSTFPDGVTI